MQKEALYDLFRGVLEADESPVVLCDLQHTIVYMNPAACVHYARFGGSALLGKNLLDCHNEASRKQILTILNWFAEERNHDRVHTFYSQRENKDVYMIALRRADGELIGYYEKHAYRTADTAPFYAMD